MSCGRSSKAERGGTTPETEVQTLPAAPFNVREIPRAVAAPFIRAHHSYGTVPTGDNIFFGCYLADGSLFAVVNYGRLAARAGEYRQNVEAEITRRPDATNKNTLELRRLCRRGSKEEKGPVQLTAVLRICHDILRKRGWRYILSYSDWGPNKFSRQFKRVKHHSGGIYKHAGFEWLGETPEEYHCRDEKGNRVHRSKAYRKMLAHNLKVCAAMIDPLSGEPMEIAREPTGNRDRIWPTDPTLWATDCEPQTLPPGKLWGLDQVRRNLGLRVDKFPPKDKWLLTLDTIRSLR